MEPKRRGRSAKNLPTATSAASNSVPQNLPAIDLANKATNGKDSGPGKEPAHRGQPRKAKPGASADVSAVVPGQTASTDVPRPTKKFKSNTRSVSAAAIAEVDSEDDTTLASASAGRKEIKKEKGKADGAKKINNNGYAGSDSETESKTSLNSKKKSKKDGKKIVKDTVVDEDLEPSVTVKKQIIKKGRAPVDELYGNGQSVHVFSEGEDVWDVALNQTAIDNNNNKFYLIQLLEHDHRKQYLVFCRWGRVGGKGQQSTKDCDADLEEAKRVFCAKFSDKTKNDWSDRQIFEKYPGKYDMVLRDYEPTDVPDAVLNPPVSGDSIRIPDSKLLKPVQTLMQTIFNIRMMEEQVMEMNYDAKKAPLGKLTDQQIKLGYASLKRIASALNLTPVRGAPPSGVPSQRELTDACNEYYTRIPHDFAMKRPSLINSPQALKREMDLLETLGDIEVAMRALKENLSLDENPLDHHYRTLGVDILPVERSDPTFTLVEQYLSLTQGPTHAREYKLELLDVFTTIKQTPFEDVGNRMLLWHGSRMSNFVGILSQGLRIAPPEAPVTGYMFGKGIYFADVSTKSANYCFSQTSQDVGMMLLCEVALGKPNELYDAKYDADQLPQGCSSTKGVGCHAPDDTTYQTMEDGLKIPVGKCVELSGKQRGTQRGPLLYNEYIVYDVKQVRMKYLVQVKFNRKRSLR